MGNKNVVLASFILFLTIVILALMNHLFFMPRVQIIILQASEQSFHEEKDAIRPSKDKIDRQLPFLQQLYLIFRDNDKKESKNEQIIQPNSQCTVIDDAHKFDCYPEALTDKEKCEARGCCWQIPHSSPSQNGRKNPMNRPMGVPFCYFPANFPGYKTGLKAITPTGFSVALNRNTTAIYPDNVFNLVMDVRYETDYRLRIRIFDPKNARYEVPLNTPKVTKAAPVQKYSVVVSKTGDPFNFAVVRKMLTPADKPAVIFNTSGAAPLIFADQYIQLSTFLPSKFLYGLGEHRGRLLQSMDWRRLTTWNRDQAPHDPDTGTNLYGHHPFYLMMEDGGRSHGFFLLNSNAKETVLQPAPALTWRTIGGILDMYMFMGPSPAEVVQQYTEVIGHTFMPPYWSLGFHLCKYGYHSVNETMDVVKRMQEAKIPQDTQWNDIDYMEEYRDFTTGTKKFGDQAAMVDTLHSMGMHYVMIVDPGISNKSPSPYPPYNVGTKMDIWIKDSTGKPLIGKVWPGDVVFPDFTNPKTTDYWTQMTKAFHDKVKFDGMWIDMNELSNFYDGSLTGCRGNKYDNPPYVPAVLGDHLKSRTICPSAQQNVSLTYNVHDLYGLTETMATYQALKTVRGTRPFVISRSTFAGQGHYGGHWSGDNYARYEDMALSVPEMLNMNMFGISMIGADICGFHDDTTEQLCQRWQQLGAFYPFSRNHNDLGKKAQDPAVFSDAMKNSTRKALTTRYMLLPYLYTLFHKSNAMGETVARPLFFEFPHDINTYGIDDQFMLGSALMITPVLTKDTTQLNTYFPASIWYDFAKGKRIMGNGSRMSMDAPMDSINVYVRGGNILPMKAASMTTTESRKNNFNLFVALNGTGQADGALFWDDGETIGTHESGDFNMIMFKADKDTITSGVMKSGYTGEDMKLEFLYVAGVDAQPKTVTVNGATAQFKYDSNNKTLTVYLPIVDLLKPFTVKWM
ncbi:lysosomal alpha-glucosidase-like [Saccostrea echinata]|uniref:lysosomal alpha-glucosidase-like n=1 Tax=Saccostrea echinata TaxID=191078 RepID=UPI002A7F86F5|nr:lysosomal alpha-glucosidase-like [Saccostrea echinata]